MRLLVLILLTPALARLAGVPRAVNVPKPCNASATCNHGNCRDFICLCDNGWSTQHAQDPPCTKHAKSQLLIVLICWFFGWIGAGAFLLGWWWYGTGILAALCGCMCCGGYAYVKSDEGEDSCCVKTAACCGCVSCCTWTALVLLVSISACIAATCVITDGSYKWMEGQQCGLL